MIAVFAWLGALVADLRLFGKPGMWSTLTTPGSDRYQPLWSTVIVYETGGNALLLLFSLVIVGLYFARWKIFRPLIIAYLSLMTIFMWGDHLLAGQISTLSEQVRSKGLLNCVSATTSALIWIPYFLVSKRVKRTFVK